MRADRLIAELMLLQTRGRVSAAEMAVELEVSQRTIYRDMLALNTAGIPIYAENGSNGGYQLVDGYRTQLTGLSTGELQALFAMNIPAILGELGMDIEAKAALRKLQASLSYQQNEESGFMAQRFLYDPTGWDSTKSRKANHGRLEKLQQAIWSDRQVEINIQHWYRPGELQMTIDPYALVLKDNRWYLVYHRKTTLRILPLQEIAEVFPLEKGFVRDTDFNLGNFWSEWRSIQQAQTQSYLVKLIVRENARSAFNTMHQKNILSFSTAQNGWHWVECAFHGLDEARGNLMQWGGAIRILEPDPLRLNMLDYAEQFLLANHQE